ncbi:MAG TPA: hypothetical protein ENJ27_02100 [Candidatus Moranbacteria bacterium]|nr:hypothetical protein [Candidatus Moranbacteria bacterium]
MPNNSVRVKSGDFNSGGKENKKQTGITAIVGPNGSGKSNIADAIRWVMGEQSMKNLRGKKMEDIIFAGSGKKGRMNYATVSLHFDNSDKGMPLDFSEVIIKRKLFRNGESEYIINGSKVRLIDIVDLLAKAGVGKDSYSVLNQGMSDAMLNASLTERRIILEDAAGVKQYQVKKRRSLKKLETTRKNLEQVAGLLNEIEPHLRSLKRQANKAQKGKDIKIALKKTQEAYYAYLWNEFREEQKKSFEQKESLGNEMMQLQKEVDKLNDFVLAESKKMRQNKKPDELREKKDKIYQEINKFEGEVMIANGKLEIIQEKIKQQNIIRSIPVDKRYIQIELKNLHIEQKKLIEKIKNVKNLEDLQDIRKFAQVVNKKIFELDGDIEKGEVQGKKTTEQFAEEKKLKDLVVDTENHKNSIKNNINKLRQKLVEIDQEIKDEIEKDEKARADFFKAEDLLREKQRKLNFLKDKFNEAKVALARIEVKEEDLIEGVKNNLRTEIHKLKYNGDKINIPEVERKIFRMKSQLEQIGGIDPLVVDEYEDTNQRYKTLQQESNDLEKAIISLEKIAKEMDKKIDKVFVTAFSKINKEFSKYFRIIFGGGKAELIKTTIAKRKMMEDIEDEEDLVNMADDDDSKKNEEIGIDIKACPPGKKISNLAMLSGGERSLTSLALLFAIISYNPPPFSILDEVEAALDEANSIRFGKILHELSNNTQFIAITHNRETMRQSSLLYGATMNDDGITKLLSVKLE